MLSIWVRVNYFIPPQNKCFRGYTGISLSVCPRTCVSVCVQNISFCKSTGMDIKSHSVIVLVSVCKKHLIIEYCIRNSLPDNKILTLLKLKARAENIFKMLQMVQFVFDRGENLVGKNRK